MRVAGDKILGIWTQPKWNLHPEGQQLGLLECMEPQELPPAPQSHSGKPAGGYPLAENSQYCAGYLQEGTARCVLFLRRHWTQASQGDRYRSGDVLVAASCLCLTQVFTEVLFSAEEGEKNNSPVQLGHGSTFGEI